MTFTIRIEKLVFSVALVGVMMGTALAGPPDWEWIVQVGSNGNDEVFDAARGCDGGICYTGLSNGSYGGANQGSFDIIGGCVDADGNEVWRGQWGTSAPDSCEACCSDVDCNFLMGGGTAGNMDGGGNNGGFDAVLIKTDQFGTREWIDQIGTSLTDGILGLDCDDNGNTVGCGFTNGSLYGANMGGTDGFIAGWDSGGTNTWGKQVGTSGADVLEDPWNSIVFPESGIATVIVTGYSSGSLGGPNQGGNDIFIGSYNSDSSTNWTTQLGTFTTDQGSRLIVDSDGNIYVTGHTFGSLFDQNQGNADGVVIKLDSTTGEVQWGRQLGSNQSDMPHALASDGTGGILIAGETNGVLGGKNQGGADGFIAHYDGDGKLLSVRQFGTTGNDKIYGIVTDNIEGVGGNLLVAGSTTGSLGGPNAGGADVFLAKFPIIPCPWDLDSNGSVGIGDLLLLLGNWGNPYGIGDLLAMLANWGPCL